MKHRRVLTTSLAIALVCPLVLWAGCERADVLSPDARLETQAPSCGVDRDAWPDGSAGDSLAIICRTATDVTVAAGFDAPAGTDRTKIDYRWDSAAGDCARCSDRHFASNPDTATIRRGTRDRELFAVAIHRDDDAGEDLDTELIGSVIVPPVDAEGEGGSEAGSGDEGSGGSDSDGGGPDGGDSGGGGSAGGDSGGGSSDGGGSGGGGSDGGGSGGGGSGGGGSGGEGSSGGGGGNPPSAHLGDVAPGPNEPVGFSQVAEAEWDDEALMDSEGWATGFDKGGTLTNGSPYENPEVVPSPDPGFPSGRVMRHTWPQGHGDVFGRGTSGGTRGGWEHVAVREMYISLWVRYDPRYRNSSGNHKMFGIGTEDGKEWLWVRAYGDAPTLRLDANAKTLFSTAPETLSRITRPNLGAAASLVVGQVYQVEIYVRMDSSVGACDGVLRLYLDGRHTHEYTDMCWRGNNARPGTFSGFVLDPINGVRIPAPEAHMWMDNVYISVR